MSHGWLLPLVSAFLVWRRRKELVEAPKSISCAGLFMVIAALILHWVGIKAQQSRFALLSLIILLWSVPLYVYGKNVARILFFPCVYLLFCIPWNFLEDMTFPLRLFASKVSVLLLNGIGIITMRTGTTIWSPHEGGFIFEIADPCSGLRSLMAIAALTAAYAQVAQSSLIKKWILFLSALPLVVIGNITRLLIIVIVAETIGNEHAVKFSHDYSGYVVFIVAVVLMMAVNGLLNSDIWRRRKSQSIEDKVPNGDVSEVSRQTPMMTHKPFVLIVVLMAATSAAIYFYGDVSKVASDKVNVNLPAVVGNYNGKDLRFCSSGKCGKSFTLNQGVEMQDCPVCHSPVDVMTPVEKALLPASTLMMKKVYTNPSNEPVLVSVVISGTDRLSIHRPQNCLPGHGFNISKTERIPVKVGGMDDLVITLLKLEKKDDVSDSSKSHGRFASMAYWYFGGKHETPYQSSMMFWMAYDRIFHDKAERWAYISILKARKGNSDSHEDNLTGFISMLCPVVRKAGDSE